MMTLALAVCHERPFNNCLKRTLLLPFAQRAKLVFGPTPPSFFEFTIRQQQPSLRVTKWVDFLSEGENLIFLSYQFLIYFPILVLKGNSALVTQDSIIVFQSFHIYKQNNNKKRGTE